MKPPSPWFYRLACLLAVLLAACQPASQPRLHTTISADGEMIATLLNAGTAQQLVRVRKLTPDQGWEQIQLPPLTGTIQFASHGRDLLLTYRRTDTKTSVLARVNLDNPAQPPEKIYEADDLAFPVEISPGQIMVRTRRAGEGGDATKQFYLSGYHWILLGIGGQVTEVGPDTVLPYPAPNIVGSGFFWMEEQIYEKKDPYPQIMAYPLPGGKAPVVSRKRFEKNTWAVDCDRKAARCLRLHKKLIEKLFF